MIKFNHLTKQEADALFAEIDEWCARTSTSFTRLMHFVGGDTGLRTRYKNGQAITRPYAFRIRNMMQQNPHGFPLEAKPVQIVERHTEEWIEARRLERERELRERHDNLMAKERAQLSPAGRAKFSAKPVWEMVA